ncbi:MAG: branched-chain amino acid ABC transporter permease [Deltaproteobacteria bacterium]|nr:branched-chain amino acid ABC transporter permease [Deltaproteobacteria bacterium]
MNMRQHYLPIGALVLLAFIPFLRPGDFLLGVLIMTLLYAYMGQAWNILGGFCGQFSVGHCAFFGVSAYAVTILYHFFGIHPLVGALVGVLAAVFLAFIIGFISLQLSGIYFSMATVALAEILRSLSLFFREVTFGTLGMSLPVKFSLGKEQYFYIALMLVVVGYIISAAVRQSRYGTFMVAIRENEDRALSLGIKSSRYKVLAAVISAAMTALGGAFYALYVLMVEPSAAFSFLVSIKIIIVVVIAGMGTLAGPLLGAFIAIVPDEIIRSWLGGSYAGMAGIIYGAVLVIVVKIKPEGVLGFLSRSRRPDLAAAAAKGGETRGTP